MAAPVNIQFIEGCFSKIDEDNNGSISMDELVGVFKSFDTDGDDKISKDEFTSAFNAKFGGSAEQAARAFSKLDKDSSGDLDLSELEGFFREMDKDGDNNISKPEFVEFWKMLLS